MKKINRNISFILCLVMVLTILGIQNISLADRGNGLYTSEFNTKGEVLRYLKENEVSKENQKILIEKLENNQLWDANKPEKLKEIPDDFYVFDPGNGSDTRYYRFEDGSFLKIECILNDSIEIDGSEKSKKLLKEKIKDKKTLNKILSHCPREGFSNGTINNLIETEPELSEYGVMSGSGYSWYYDYLIELRIGTCLASMVTEFVTVYGGNDYLVPSGFFEPRAEGFGELGQFPEIEIIRVEEQSSMSRWALANSHWYHNYPISTPWGGASTSGTKYLWLGVGNNTFRVSDSLPY